jgi:ubiquinone/menaquinone biosynthesis C-methylase UbiE
MNSFDHIAGRYDEWYQTPLGQTADRLEKKAVFALATAEPGTVCLDVGCGTGNYALDLAAKGLSTVCLDSSGEMLRASGAKARQAGLHTRLVQARAEHMPFRTGIFDLVISVSTLEFAEDQEAAAREMLRVLKPGGQVVVGVLMRWSVWALLRRLKGALASTVYRSARFLSAREVYALLRSAGCDSVRTRGAVFILPIKWRTFLVGAAAADYVGRRMHLPGAAFLAAAGRKPA